MMVWLSKVCHNSSFFLCFLLLIMVSAILLSACSLKDEVHICDDHVRRTQENQSVCGSHISGNICVLYQLFDLVRVKETLMFMFV